MHYRATPFETSLPLWRMQTERRSYQRFASNRHVRLMMRRLSIEKGSTGAPRIGSPPSIAPNIIS